MYAELPTRLRNHAIAADSGYEIGNSMYLDILKAAEAIEELQGWNNALSESVAMLTKRLAELSKPRWIPVTERLPEKEEEVLVLVKYKWSEQHFYSLDTYSEIDGGWVRNERVTHWMPLPQPPKEET